LHPSHARSHESSRPSECRLLPDRGRPANAAGDNNCRPELMDLSQATTEARNPASADLDRLTPLELVRLMNAEDATVAAAVASQACAIAAAIERITARLRAGGRLVYIGAGTSGRLGVLDASECPPTFNSEPGQVIGLIAGGPPALTSAIEGAEDSQVAAIQDLDAIGFGPPDCLIGIATSGRTPYVAAALNQARRLGAFTVALTCNERSDLEGLAEVMIVPVVGPEILTGSTRLKAGTATKLVLNTISTGVMVGLGKTFGNLMVDLQTRNEKLADRSRRIVMELTGLDPEAAIQRLKACGGDTKTAIVSARRGCEPDVARALLEANGGRLREALDSAARVDGFSSTATERQDLVIGVDGGGTKTVAWICGDQRIGLGEAGPSNPLAAGWTVAEWNIAKAVERAIASAAVDWERVAAICLAIAGTGQSAIAGRLRAWAERRWPGVAVSVVPDIEAVLAAGLGNGPGIALICGTGSIAVGRNERGETARAGGWGWLVGDEGSAFAIGQAAIKAIFQAADGRREPTGLAPLLLEGWKLPEIAALRRAMSEAADPRIWLAECGGMVLRAGGDDPDRRALVQKAAIDLAELVASVGRRLDLDSACGELRLAVAGTAMVKSNELRNGLVTVMESQWPGKVRVVIVSDAVEGAVRIANLLAGLRS
jgi:N-acetylmuramic acid 6-phosphate etherase